MFDETLYSNHKHPLVSSRAKELAGHCIDPIQKLEALFIYVRDQIEFGFNYRWDEVKASEVLEEGKGYCNTKATLLVALCRAIEIPARLHFGDINMNIMYGIIPGIF